MINFFIHVPKDGGSTLQAKLQHDCTLHLKRYISLTGLEEINDNIDAINIANKYEVIAGHNHLSYLLYNQKYIQSSYIYITLIRNPLSTCTSLWRYNKYILKLLQWDKNINIAIEQQGWRGYSTLRFMKLNDTEDRYLTLSQQIEKIKKINQIISIIGITEYFNEFMAILTYHFYWIEPSLLPKRNPSNKFEHKDDILNDNSLLIIQNHLKDIGDYLFYNSMVRRFYKHFNALCTTKF